MNAQRTLEDTTYSTASTLAEKRLQSFYALTERLYRGDSLRELLVFVTDTVLSLTAAQRGAFLLDDDVKHNMCYIELSRDSREPYAPRWIFEGIPQQVIERVFAKGEPHLENELASTTTTEAASSSSTIGSVLAVPFEIDKRCIGMLYLDHPRPGMFQREDIQFVRAFARYVVLDMYRARQQRSERYTADEGLTSTHLTYLNRIGSVLTSSLDLSYIFQVIMDAVNELLGTERTSVFLIDEETNELILRYSNEGNTDIRLPAPWQGIAGWVATHDTPTLVNDASNDPRHLREVAQNTGYEPHSILCVPLRVEGRVIGVVEVLNKLGDEPFTLYHQELLTELTQWAAIALQNARLYEERVQAYDQLRTEQKRRSVAEARGAMATVVLDMAHTMNNVIGAIRVWALMLEQQLDVVSTIPPEFELLRNIRRNAEEAIELIRTLRGPLEQAVIASIDVHHCLEAAIRNCWWHDSIWVHVQYGEGVPPVLANGERLETVFQNLIANAIQAIGPNTGTITIWTHRTHRGWTAITIQDDGPGIAPEVQDKLFTPGVSDRKGRLGIGLWLVETFIHQFGGTIDWSSSPETGTIFTIHLPPEEGASIGEGKTDNAVS